MDGTRTIISILLSESILPWPRDITFFFPIPSLGVRKVACLRRAAFFQRVKFVCSSLYLNQALINYFFPILVTQVGSFLSFHRCLPKNLLSIFFQLLFHILAFFVEWIVPWPWYTWMVYWVFLKLSRSKILFSMVEGLAFGMAGVIVAWSRVAVF